MTQSNPHDHWPGPVLVQELIALQSDLQSFIEAPRDDISPPYLVADLVHEVLGMTSSVKICEYLTARLNSETDVSQALLVKTLANDAIAASELVCIRCIDGVKFITLTGIISAIGRALGDPIASVYDNRGERLIRFDARSQINSV
jgi:hypothetical protein